MSNRLPLDTMTALGKGEMKEVKGSAVNQMDKFFQKEMEVSPVVRQPMQPMGFGAR